MQKFHIVIISWHKKYEQAHHIAQSLSSLNIRISVIYSNPENQLEKGPGNWQIIDNSSYFGPKFAKALEMTAPDEILMIIHADTSFDHWPNLVKHAKQSFTAYPDLGIWAPDFTHTPWKTKYVTLLPMPDNPNLYSVTQTDGIIFALSPKIWHRLMALDIAANNLGWGIDWAAIAIAYSQNMLVLRDCSLIVTHAKGRSYKPAEAKKQMAIMLSHLSITQQNQIALLYNNIRQRHHAGRSVRYYLWEKLFNRPPHDPLKISNGI